MPNMDVVKYPVVRVFLVIAPFLMTLRFGATAVWSEPSGVGILGAEWSYRGSFWLATVLSVVWGFVSRSHLRASSMLGFSFALLCLFQAVNLLTFRDSWGKAIYIATTFWISFAVMCVSVTFLSIQYIIIKRPDARVTAERLTQ